MAQSKNSENTVNLLLTGDVMLGRGIDQILLHPSLPNLHESYMKNAEDYVKLAEDKNGPIPRQVPYDYVWGDALEEFKNPNIDVRIINLETTITTHNAWENKGINYRMNPMNLPCLQKSQINCCVLANNHILDWKEQGLQDTHAFLVNSDIKTAGAGLSLEEASAPAILPLAHHGHGRVLVFSFGSASSGIPAHWGATEKKPGVNFLPELTETNIDTIIDSIKALVEKWKQPNDIIVFSIHWGGNWGYEIPEAHRAFAHALIDQAHVDLIHGHSSHHALGIEKYRDKLILYGCGDFINDYEGISGHENYRDDLAIAYIVSINSYSGACISLTMKIYQIKHFCLNSASVFDVTWLKNVLNREGKILGTQVDILKKSSLILC